MRGIVARLKATASDDQVTETARGPQEEAIIAYVDSLPEPQRTMMLMRHRDGKTYGQIAEALGWGKTAVLKSLSKIYSELRIALEPSG